MPGRGRPTFFGVYPTNSWDITRKRKDIQGPGRIISPAIRVSLLITRFNYGLPKASKDPNNRVLGPRYHLYYSIWALKPYYLGPWTLRVGVQGTRALGSDLRF